MTDSSLDQTLARWMAAAYLMVGLLSLPPAVWPRAAGLALLLMLTAVLVAGRLGRGRLALFEVFGVTLAAAAVLAVPTFPAYGGEGHWATWYGGLGAQAVTLLWVAERWVSPGPTPRRLRLSFGEVMRYALIATLLLSAVATIPIILILWSDDPRRHLMLGVYPSYLAGFAAAGVAYWSLQGIAHTGTGRYLLGMLGGICVYGAAAPVALASRGEPFELPMAVGIAYVAGALVGPSIALTWE